MFASGDSRTDAMLAGSLPRALPSDLRDPLASPIVDMESVQD